MDHGNVQDNNPLDGFDDMEQGRSSTANEMMPNPHGGASATSAFSPTTSSSRGGDTSAAVSRGPRPLEGPLPGRSDDGAAPTTLQTFASEVQAVLDAAVRTEDAEDTPASSAERHRLANSIGIDLPSVAHWVEKSFPFWALLAMVFAARHSIGIVVFVIYNFGLHRLHVVSRQQAALKGERHKRVCFATAALSILGMGSLMWAFSPQKLWMNLLLANVLPLRTVWEVMFTVTMADVLVRHLSVAVQLLAIGLLDSKSRSKLRRRSQILAFVNHAALFWRTLLGTPCWASYLCSAVGRWGASCAGVFMMLKLSTTYDRGAVMVASGIALRRGAAGMKAATASELSQAGTQCSICHDDIRDPMRLSCSHVFCEDCISEWLEREGSCPYCRRVIQSPAIRNAERSAMFPLIF